MKSYVDKAIAFCTAHTTLVRSVLFLATAIIIVTTPLLNALLSFLIVGQIPGANRTIPYWMMMVGYVAVITAIITYFVETAFRPKKSQASQSPTSRSPRRRYSHS